MDFSPNIKFDWTELKNKYVINLFWRGTVRDSKMADVDEFCRDFEAEFEGIERADLIDID